MAERRSIHWTDDDELLSKFVLHQLPAGEEAALSSHLSTCGKCRHAVNEETTIVAGARLAGRAALKEQLRLRLSESEQRVTASPMRKPAGYQVPWRQFASVAAVVTILIAVGVFNNWFISNSWNKSTPQEQVAQKQEPLTPESGNIENKESPPEKFLGKDIDQSVGSAEQDYFDNRRVKRIEILKQKTSEHKRIAHEKSATSVTVEPAANAGAVADEGKAEKELQMIDEAVVPESQTYWVEGHVIQDALEESRGMLSATPRDQVSSVRKKDDHQVSKSGNDIAMPTISLNQEPSSSLPASLQYRQDRQGVIQTLIENKDNAIQITLYLDSPVADSELYSAKIQVINTDSLVLNLFSQCIGFRLPPGLQSQINAKAKQVK
jgi:hypothetical protein